MFVLFVELICKLVSLQANGMMPSIFPGIVYFLQFPTKPLKCFQTISPNICHLQAMFFNMSEWNKLCINEGHSSVRNVYSITENNMRILSKNQGHLQHRESLRICCRLPCDFCKNQIIFFPNRQLEISANELGICLLNLISVPKNGPLWLVYPMVIAPFIWVAAQRIFIQLVYPFMAS